jgi:hypothetical protein
MRIEADGSSMKLTLAGRRLLRTNSDHDECIEMRVYKLKTGGVIERMGKRRRRRRRRRRGGGMTI